MIDQERFYRQALEQALMGMPDAEFAAYMRLIGPNGRTTLAMLCPESMARNFLLHVDRARKTDHFKSLVEAEGFDGLG